MVQNQPAIQYRSVAPYGNDQRLRDTLDQQRICRRLTRRLVEKIENYEREAARLEIRGQADPAQVLRKAASQLRAITKNTVAPAA